MLPRTGRKPWLELIIYLLLFVVVGIGLYLLKRQIKGPARPTHVPMHSSEEPAPVGRR